MTVTLGFDVEEFDFPLERGRGIDFGTQLAVSSEGLEFLLDLLARLGTDYVDIGMIHYVDAEADLRKVLDGPILQLALRLRSEGRIRHIGISSHNPAVARQAAETGLIDVLMFSLNPCYDLCRRATTWTRSGPTKAMRRSCTTSTPNASGSTNSANAKAWRST